MTDDRLAGWLDGKTHRYPLRVYYAETDAGTIVHHAAYLVFAERGRTEMMRRLGIDHLQLKTEQGLVFAVRSCEIDCLRSARLDDTLEVRSTLIHLGGASFHVAQSIWRDDEELVRLAVRLVCMHLSGGAKRLPTGVRGILQEYLSQEAD